MEVGIRLIQLHSGKFGVVLGVHALVAEDAPDLVYAVHAAHDQPLERKLGGNAHIHINIERIVVRDKRARGSAAGDGVEHRRFDLDIAHIIQIIPQMLDELRADDEVALDLGVHDQVDITLTIAGLLVGQAVELLGQRQQGFGQERDRLRAHGHFAALGAEDLALDADDIADVIFLEAVVRGLVHLILAGVELDAAGLVLQIAEGDLAHAALGHETARDGDGFALHLVKMVLDLLCGRGADEAGDGKRVHPLGLQLRELFAADLDLVAEADLRSRVLLIPVFLFHIVPLICFCDSLLFDRQDLVLEHANGRFDIDDIADLMAEQRLAERRVVGDAALHGVGLLRADDGVELLVTGLHILNLDGAAEADLAFGVLGLVDDDGVGKDVLDLGDAAVELGLLVLGLVVFAVFGKVAEGARLLDLLGYFLLTRRLQIKKFLLQLFEAERTDLEFFCHD